MRPLRFIENPGCRLMCNRGFDVLKGKERESQEMEIGDPILWRFL